MDSSTSVVSAQSSRSGAGVVRDFPAPAEGGRHVPRHPTPLQVSTVPSVTTGTSHTSSRSPRSPMALRSISDSSTSPRSPRSNVAYSAFDQPKSPRERIEEFLASEEVRKIDGTSVEASPVRGMAVPQATPKQSGSQLRNTSSPLPESQAAGALSPPSPASMSSSPPTASNPRQEMRNAPRQSSIDSAISNVSVSRPIQDVSSPTTSSDIVSLIRSAGSPEAVIQRLLKEKSRVTAQNTQLWTLLEKQKVMIKDMKESLDRTSAERDGYRRKLKSLQDASNPASIVASRMTNAQLARESSQSPAPSELSADLLPIQRQSIDSIIPEATVKPLTIRGAVSKPQTTAPRSNHSHKKTSSSDVNVFTSFASSEQPPQFVENDISQGTNGSFTAKRTQVNTKPFAGADLILPERSPTSPGGGQTRKAPPAPLDLGSAKAETWSPTQVYGPGDHSESEYEDNAEDEPVQRGRKKTREDDDRDREAALAKEEENRSRSAKQKASKSRSVSSKSTTKQQPLSQQAAPMPPSIVALAPEPTPMGGSFLYPPGSLAGVLNSQDQRGGNITQRSLAATPLSPGLPTSPRPTDRPLNPPTPRQPREMAVPGTPLPMGLPLSPRAPRQAIPLPMNTPMAPGPTSPRHVIDAPRKDSTSSGQGSLSSGTKNSSVDEHAEIEHLGSLKAGPPKGVFKGFISEQYPGLLIPPNALPSIRIRVVSSRLRPSRNSLVLKGADEEPVFILGVSARYDKRDLWQVEKPIMSLQQLDTQLRQSTGFNVKLPDRNLFNGHAPAKVDARRVALENYFESILDTQLDDRGGISLCQYLSTNVMDPEARNVAPAGGNTPATPRTGEGRLRKDGYLTKRGKNFGGWKARYFVLDKPILEYYESPGGKSGPLGQIRLHNAQIGKQSPKSSSSPSRYEDGDGQFRHAFLIREPKRKDANSFVDHVLCAESDAERDAWVAALLCYVDAPVTETERPRTAVTSSAPSSTRSLPQVSSKKLEDSPEMEDFDTLQAVPYEDTRPAQAPHVSVTPDVKPVEAPSPTVAGLPRPPTANQPKTISGPSNGAKISDVGAWGNKPMATSLTNVKDQKKRSIFSFRDNNKAESPGHHTNGSNLNLTQEQLEYQEHATNVKAVFGAPLAEAVQYCGPKGVDVCLPAVVYRCLEYLRAKNAAAEEGLFRMSGSNNLIKHLRHKFNTEGDFDFLGEGQPYFDIHAVASLLKLYLRELPSMILTKELHMSFCQVLGESRRMRLMDEADQCLELPEYSKKVVAYNVLVRRLPKPNFCLIKALCSYLMSVVNNSDVNKMGVRNVGIVFSPTLNIPTPVFSLFLNDFADIFEREMDPSNLEGLPPIEAGPSPSTSEGLTMDDIRSPRRQMFSDLPTPSYNQASFAKSQQQQQQQAQPQRTTPLSREEQLSLDMGFTPLQPSYDDLATINYGGINRKPSPSSQMSSPGPIQQQQQQQGGSTLALGPDQLAMRLQAQAQGDVSGQDNVSKSSRRESSMIVLGAGQRKNSMPMMRPPGGADSRENLLQSH